MDISLGTHEVISLVALFAGFLSAITGSSGMIILPTLLLTGLPPHVALGTNKLFTTTSLFSASCYYISRGLFQPKFWIATTLACALGSIAGVGITQLVSSNQLNVILPIIITGIAIYMIFNKNTISTNQPQTITQNKTTIATSTLLGAYSGFIGAGTAAIWINLAAKKFNMSLLQASAMAQYMCFITNLTALLVFMLLSEIHYGLGLCLGVFGSLGAILGSKVATRAGENFIKNTIITICLLMSANLVVDNWFIS